MYKRYRLINIEKAADKTHEAEKVINAFSRAGWAVEHYAIEAFRGVMQPGFRHLILFAKDEEEDHEHQWSRSMPSKQLKDVALQQCTQCGAEKYIT